MKYYSKNPKNIDTRFISVITLKFEHSTIEYIWHPKDTHEMANSVDTDLSLTLFTQTASGIYGPRHEKPVFGVFDQVRLKPVCSSTETS